MPSYRSITISLISQFDILTIPEYAPPSAPRNFDPFTDSTTPALVSPDTSLVSVYIPTYPSSQFWLSYSISPPYPPGLLYYFKLYINGRSVVSWGCGEEDGFKGKTMFGLFASPRGRGVERRVFAFGPQVEEAAGMKGSGDDVMEVKVFRSKGRRRVFPDIKEFRGAGTQSSAGGSNKIAPSYNGDGVDLINAGFLHQKNPQRYYRYTLLDPSDQPFSTFRYYYRSWEQLEVLGVISPPPSVGSSSIRTTLIEQSASRKSSIDTTASLEGVLDAFNAVTLERSSSNKSTEHVHSSPMSQSDSATQLAIPCSRSTKSMTTNFKHQYRPATPPTFSSALEKPALLPTATNSLPRKVEELSTRSVSSSSTPRSSSSSTRPSSPSKKPILASIPTLTHQSSKENFAAIIRTHLPSPNPDTFKLTDLSSTIEKTSSMPLRTPLINPMERSGGSVGVLRSVFGRENLRPGNHKMVIDHSIGETMEKGGSGGTIRSRSTDGLRKQERKEGSRTHHRGQKTEAIKQTVEEELLARDFQEGSDDGDTRWEKGKEKKRGEKVKIGGFVRIKNDISQRGRSRSTSEQGRKFNLWEEL